MSAGNHEQLLWRNPLLPETFPECPPRREARAPSEPSRPPSPKRRDVLGTVNIAGGYRIRSRRAPHRPIKKTSIFARDTQIDQEQYFHSEEDRIAFLKWQKQDLLDRRIFREKINRKVKSVMEAYEQDLARRKEVQRELQLKQHIELTRKLVEEARREEEKRLEDLAAKAAEAEVKRERERQEFIHTKMLQRQFINSSELRDQRWNARVVDRKRVNLVQMENNRRRLEQERKEELNWSDVMRRYSEQGGIKEKLKEEKRAEQRRAQAEVHLEQKAQKYLNETLWKSEQNNPATLDVGEIRNYEERKRAQIQQTREDLEKQMIETRKILEERRQQEEEIDKLGTGLEVGEQMDPEEARRDRERRHREIKAYMEHLKIVRQKIAQRQAEVDECVREMAKKRAESERESRCHAKEEERRVNRELPLYWDQQLEEKRRREKQRLDELKEQDEGNYLELARAEKAARRQKAREYGLELVEQQETIQARRDARLTMETEEVNRQMDEMERQERELSEELSRTCLRHQLSGIIP